MCDQIDINIALNQSTTSHFNAALPFRFIQLNGSDEERRIFNKCFRRMPQNVCSVIASRIGEREKRIHAI